MTGEFHTRGASSVINCRETHHLRHGDCLLKGGYHASGARIVVIFGGDLFSYRLTRRTAVTGLGSGLVLIALGQVPSRASDAETESVIRDLFGDARPQIGRITLSVPSLAESGNSVPLTVSIDSPMTESDHVRRVCIFANRNPRPLIATMTFGPNSGTAAFSTNMRLSGTQDVIAMAQMSDGTLWTEQARVMVTVGACDSLQMRY